MSGKPWLGEIGAPQRMAALVRSDLTCSELREAIQDAEQRAAARAREALKAEVALILQGNAEVLRGANKSPIADEVAGHVAVMLGEVAALIEQLP